MSWDVLLFNYAGKKPPAPDFRLTDAFKSPSMGSADDVRAAISKHLPGVDWSDPKWGKLDGGAYRIEFSIGTKTTLNALMLHVHGSGDPVSAIVTLCKGAGWSALDCSMMEWINPKKPSMESWTAFHQRERILERDRALCSPRWSPSCPKCQRHGAMGYGRCFYCG